MDKSAIEAIAKLAIQENRSSSEYEILYGDQKLESKEKFRDVPNIFRGKFTTSSVNDFASYINGNSSVNSNLYIDHCQGKAKCIIDQGTDEEPLWGKHTSELVLMMSPEYSALLNSNGVKINQQTFIDFIEDNSSFINFYNDELPLSNKNAVAVFRKLKIDAQASSEQSVGNFSKTASAMEAIEIKATGLDAIPSHFNFKFSPYDGFPEVTAICTIRISTDDKKMLISYRVTSLESLQKNIALLLIDMLDEKITVKDINKYLGRMEYQ